ncbi:hypothetical protein K438DRAFT_1757861 [Mycena galopus ATCC 62051]|nr:hypothetical protein K438DRAFT_1757861 [Mycena galopus ATCC 62051]
MHDILHVYTRFTRLIWAKLANQLGCLFGKIGAFRDAHWSEFEKFSALGKLRATVVKICSSPQYRKHFMLTSKAIYKDECAPSGKLLCVLMVIRDTKNRWNYDYPWSFASEGMGLIVQQLTMYGIRTRILHGWSLKLYISFMVDAAFILDVADLIGACRRRAERQEPGN